MKPSQLLLQTETHLATHRRSPVNLVKRMTGVPEPVVPHRDIGKHLQDAASLLAEYRPTDLATICRQYFVIRMQEAADRFIRDQYGRRDAAMITGIWLRRAAEGRPYPAISLRPGNRQRPIPLPPRRQVPPAHGQHKLAHAQSPEAKRHVQAKPPAAAGYHRHRHTTAAAADQRYRRTPQHHPVGRQSRWRHEYAIPPDAIRQYLEDNP